MSERPRSDARRGELLRQLVQAGARIQRELSRDEVLHRACESLEALGLRCSIAHPEAGGVRVREVHLGEQLDSIERAMGAPIVGPVRPFTPLLRRVWDEGGAYTDRWPEEVSAFMGVSLVELLGRIGDGGFTRGIGVRVDEAGAPAVMIFSTGAWLREEDVDAFRLFAEQLGASLDAAHTVARLRERNSELAALNRLAAVAAAVEDLGPMLDAAVAVVAEATGASAAGIAVFPKGADGRRVHATSGVPEFAAMLRDFSEEEPTFVEVMREGKVRVGHLEVIPPEFAERWDAAGLGTFALAPLRFRGEPVGVLAAVFRDRRDAGACHVELLGAMSGQLGTAIENHDLLESRARRISELTMLNDVAAATVALDPALLLDSAVRRVCATFRADGAAAYVEDGGRRRRVAAVGFSHSLAEAPATTGDDPTSLAIARKTAVRWPGHIGDTPRVRWFRDREGVRSVAAVPMLAKDRTVGCFVLARRSPEPFSDEDLRLLTAVGVQLGVAVDAARLYDDLRRSYAALGRAQEQLIQQERLAALGQLAAVIAHEVRNPLGVIFNSLGSLRRMLHPRGDPKMLLDIIGEEADRLNRIVGDLLDFARPAPVALEPEPLDRVIDEAAQAAGLDPRIRFERDVAPGLPPVPMDARLVRQALLNLFTNAVQAMPAGGTLSIAARLEEDSVRIDVTDTGDGVPEDVRQRIFEPFFTTRPTGTGLGLAVVKRILDDHRGSIRLEPGDPVGTRFVVRLPLSIGAATRETVERSPRGE